MSGAGLHQRVQLVIRHQVHQGEQIGDRLFIGVPVAAVGRGREVPQVAIEHVRESMPHGEATLGRGEVLVDLHEVHAVDRRPDDLADPSLQWRVPPPHACPCEQQREGQVRERRKLGVVCNPEAVTRRYQVVYRLTDRARE